MIDYKRTWLTKASWGAKKIYGTKYNSGPDVDDWEDKRQDAILKELEEKERLKKQRQGTCEKKNWKRKKGRRKNFY